jgi:predicted dehydrogenase
MKKVKFGIIGMGVMGQAHLKTLQSIASCDVTAICDNVPDQIEKIMNDATVTTGFRTFNCYRELIDSGLCDAVAVVTAHPSHLEISKYAFAKGLHVMCDKPITITVSEADQLLAAWQQAKTKFCTMYSMRTTQVNKVIKDWIDTGKLGKIHRIEMTCTEWLRTQKYYDSQKWRGTWNGEGGGLLMNQAPHNLDLLYWWCGDADSIQAEVTNRFHDIETEDEIRATIWTKNGYPINFYANTGEAPGKDYVEIVADNGTLIRQNGKLFFKKLAQPLGKIVKEHSEPIPVIEAETQEITIPDQPRGHKIVFDSFIANILQNLPHSDQIAPGADGIHAVEWANAMLLSSIKQQSVSLPVNRDVYDKLLYQLRTREITL